MAWTGNPRTTTPAWRALRRSILKRDNYTCHVCGLPGADEVDHLQSWIDCTRLGIDPDHPTNLAAIHDDPCHRHRTAIHAGPRGGRASGVERARRAALRQRPPEQHPGYR